MNEMEVLRSLWTSLWICDYAMMTSRMKIYGRVYAVQVVPFACRRRSSSRSRRSRRLHELSLQQLQIDSKVQGKKFSDRVIARENLNADNSPPRMAQAYSERLDSCNNSP